MSKKRRRLDSFTSCDDKTLLAERITAPRSISSVHTFSADTSEEELLSYYKENQILHIKSYVNHCTDESPCIISQIRKLFTEAPGIVEKTFTLESDEGREQQRSASTVFGPSTCPPGAYYCSFIAQGGKCESIENFEATLPLVDLPFGRGEITCTKPIWTFVGKNDGNKYIEGRKEHIDAVSHDGTWHVQSSGKKIWYVRPAETSEWGTDKSSNLIISGCGAHNLDSGENELNSIPRLRVECDTGDVLLINTRMWWHQTHLPPTGKPHGLSISYARDFFAPSLRHVNAPQRVECDSDQVSSKRKEGNSVEEENEDEEEYTNVDGLYASRNVVSGEVVLTEDEMPDCSVIY